MAQVRLVELLTGEGKTLVATLPLTLYSLFKKGAHIVTVNDYFDTLSSRSFISKILPSSLCTCF